MSSNLTYLEELDIKIEAINSLLKPIDELNTKRDALDKRYEKIQRGYIDAHLDQEIKINANRLRDYKEEYHSLIIERMLLEKMKEVYLQEYGNKD